MLVSITQLPVDTIHHTCSFIGESTTLFSLRHSHPHFYDASASDVKQFFVVDILILDSEKQYFQYFNQLMESVKNGNLSEFHLGLLNIIMTGSSVALEQYGIKERYILDMFFECLFVLLPREENEEVTSVFLKAMQSNISFWRALDGIAGGILPRSHFLKLFIQLKDQPDKLNRALNCLTAHDIKFPSLRFSTYDYDAEYNSFIPRISWGFTTLHLACWINNKAVVDTLVTSQSVNSQDGMGLTCLHHCVLDDDLLELAKHLVQSHSADPWISDVENITPIYLAHLHGKHQILSFFRQIFGEDSVSSHLELFGRDRPSEELTTLDMFSSLWEFSEHSYGTIDLEDKMLKEFDEWAGEMEKNDGLYINLEKPAPAEYIPRYESETFSRELRDREIEERDDTKSSSSEYSGDLSFEEGISFDFVRSKEIREIEEICDLFEKKSIEKIWCSDVDEDDVYDSEPEEKIFSLIPQRTPLATLQEMIRKDNEQTGDKADIFNENQKRLIAFEEGSPFKKMKLEDLETRMKDAIVTRSGLHFSKQAIRLVLIEIISDYKTAAIMSPLTCFIIQDAMEKKLLELIESASRYSAYFKRSLNAMDIRHALNRASRPLKATDTSYTIPDEDTDSWGSYETESSVSSENYEMKNHIMVV